MGFNMERVKFTVSLRSGSDIRWYKRNGKTDYPHILYVNGLLVSESNNVGDMNRTYEEYAAN